MPYVKNNNSKKCFKKLTNFKKVTMPNFQIKNRAKIKQKLSNFKKQRKNHKNQQMKEKLIKK